MRLFTVCGRVLAFLCMDIGVLGCMGIVRFNNLREENLLSTDRLLFFLMHTLDLLKRSRRSFVMVEWIRSAVSAPLASSSERDLLKSHRRRGDHSPIHTTSSSMQVGRHSQTRHRNVTFIYTVGVCVSGPFTSCFYIGKVFPDSAGPSPTSV